MSLTYRLDRLAKDFILSRKRDRLSSEFGIRLMPDIPFDYFQTGKVIRSYNPPVAKLIDIGAHKGFFTAAMQHFWRLEKAVCVEPNHALQKELRKRVGPDVEILNSALGPENGTAEYFLHPDTSMNSLVPVNDEIFRKKFLYYTPEEIDSCSVCVNTLDSLADRFSSSRERNTLLKIDTQGNELEVLRSGTRFLEFVSFAVIEWMFWEGYETRTSLSDLVRFMEEQKFKSVGVSEPKYRQSGEVAFADFLFFCGNR